MKKISKILSIVLVLAMLMGFALVANAEDASATYTFADYQVEGELGGGEASRQLDDDVTFTISAGWFSKEARIYKNENGMITSTKAISAIVLNAGYKDSTFDVYTSVDGAEWSMYQEDVTYVKGYSDVEITFDTPVKYIKIDAPNAQVRIKNMTVTFAETAEEEPEVPTNYYVIGSTDIFGNWTNPNESGLMTQGEDGLYTKVYENVPGGDYELKVNVGDWTHSWGENGYNGTNVFVTVDDTSTVTVTFDAVAETVKVDVVPNEVEQPDDVIIADGEYVIYAPAYNKALSSEKTSFYNVGVDVTLTNDVLSGYGETEIWVINNNEDGSITISQNGQNLAMADEKSSMNLGEVNDKWVLEDLGNGLFYVKNVVRAYYIEWYAKYSNWSTYNKIYDDSVDLFSLAFYPVVEEEPEAPTEYYVTGQDTLCGSNWNPGDEANIMTKGDNGLYTKVYENVAAGEYQLKVTAGDWTQSWGGDGPEGNFLAVVEATSTVTVIFDAETNTISVEITPVETEPDEPTIVDIATALAGADGVEFTVQGVVVCIEGGKNVYIQDATGAICVRTSDMPADLTLGYTITATGTKGVFNGLPQLNNSTYVADYTAQDLSPKETTIGALTAADICTYIKLTGVTVTEVFDNNGAFTTPNITVTDGTDTIQIYKAVVAKNEDGSWAIKVGDTIDVCAAVGYYNKFQLRNTLADEITVIAEEEPEVTTNYYVTGSTEIFGDWAPLNESGLMTKGDDGLYTKTFENVPAADAAYELKVNIGDWSASWGEGGFNGGNVFVTVDTVSTVTVVFDAEAGTVTVLVVPTEIDEPDGPENPDPEQPDEPGDETISIADGDYVIYAPAYNMALSSVYNGYYNTGVAVTLTDDVLSGYGETEIWTVTNNDDGTITISIGGQKLAMGEKFTSMPLDEINDQWVIEDAGDGLFYVKNVVRESYIEWFAQNNNWSGYHTIAEGSEGMFALSFVPVNIEEDPENPENPEQPEDPEVIPGTGDMAIAGLIVAMMAATAGAVVLKKKEF